MNWHAYKPITPIIGDCYFDHSNQSTYIYVDDFKGWNLVAASGSIGEPPFTVPTTEQLEKHPSLKAAWDDFLVIKKLLGV